MAAWRVDAYPNRRDLAPAKTGLVVAADYEAAQAIVRREMAQLNFARADMTPTLLSRESDMPSGHVRWL